MITATDSPRFLIIQTAFIGDVILATALLEQLHRRLPDARIDVLVRKGSESLLSSHPFLNEVLVWDKKRSKYAGLWALLRLIRRRRYTAVLNLQRFGSTGFLTAMSKAETTIGFDKNPFSRFFTAAVPHKFVPGIHEVDRNAQMLTRLPARFGFSDSATAKPRLYPTESDYAVVRPWQQQPYVCMAPMSVWFTKQYPAERWQELIAQLPDTLTVYLLGAPTDRAACDAILAAVGKRAGLINLAGQLTLLQSAALQKGAVMNYVNDSAPLHLCSAMNAPTTAVFCSTVPEFGFGPLADGARVVQTTEPLTCKPCNLHGRVACPLGHFRCAWGISVDDLAGAIG